MPRKLKTYITSMGFFDLAVAAPSMKAALEAWGAERNLFHQGTAEETDDASLVKATMAQPGVVLRRGVGTNNPYEVNGALPKSIPAHAKPRRANAKPKPPSKPANSPRAAKAPTEKAQKAAIIQFEKEKARREKERAREEVERQREEESEARDAERRQRAIDKAEAIRDRARERHEAKTATLEKEVEAAQGRLEAERDRWKEESEELERDIRKADR